MTTCCHGEGDTKRMCFTLIGDLSKMTADDIIRVRACKHTPYAIAYWAYNKHYDELQLDPEFWMKDKYIQLITQGDTAWFNKPNYNSSVTEMESYIMDALYDMEWDDRYDE